MRFKIKEIKEDRGDRGDYLSYFSWYNTIYLIYSVYHQHNRVFLLQMLPSDGSNNNEKTLVNKQRGRGRKLKTNRSFGNESNFSSLVVLNSIKL